MIALLLALVAQAATPNKTPDLLDQYAQQVIDPNFDDFWKKEHDNFNANGVGREEARQTFIWSILQYDLGRCYKWTKPADTRFWHNWIRDRRTATIPALRMLMVEGDKHYAQGLREGPRQVTPYRCDVEIGAMIKDMKR